MPAAVPEELADEHFVREAGTVKADKLAAAAAPFMDVAGKTALAAAGFAEKQDGQKHGRHALHLFVDAAKRCGNHRRLAFLGLHGSRGNARGLAYVACRGTQGIVFLRRYRDFQFQGQCFLRGRLLRGRALYPAMRRLGRLGPVRGLEAAQKILAAQGATLGLCSQGSVLVAQASFGHIFCRIFFLLLLQDCLGNRRGRNGGRFGIVGNRHFYFRDFGHADARAVQNVRYGDGKDIRSLAQSCQAGLHEADALVAYG